LADISKSVAQRSPCIEDCRGDFDSISQLIERSWADNTQQSLFYSAEFLASCFEYPGATLSLAPSIYDGPTPVAFAAGLPRRVRLRGRDLNLVVVTLLTAANEHKKRGYGIVIGTNLVKKARAAGYDGMVNYNMQGESMDGIILRCCRMLNLPTVRNCAVPYWSRIIQPRKIQTGQAAPAADVVERFLELTAPVAKQTPLARLWSREEAEWQCQRRFGSVVVELEAGWRRGMLVGYITPVANASRTKCLMIEDVLWGNLESQECEVLVKTLLDRAAVAGAELAVVPHLGYADLKPLHAARFRPSGRVQHVHVTVWNGEPFMEALPSMYLDII
jgi:hypothetical protein